MITQYHEHSDLKQHTFFVFNFTISLIQDLGQGTSGPLAQGLKCEQSTCSMATFLSGVSTGK